jgi:DNA-binding response OmpR family regulator
MRRVPELAGTPIIAVTAWPPGLAPSMVAAYGFDGYITKPINYSTFGAQIAAYLPTGAN